MARNDQFGQVIKETVGTDNRLGGLILDEDGYEEWLNALD